MNERELYLILRRRKGISQTKLSKVLNCSQSLISRFEKGECKMSDAKIKKYKQYIDNK